MFPVRSTNGFIADRNIPYFVTQYLSFEEIDLRRMAKKGRYTVESIHILLSYLIDILYSIVVVFPFPLEFIYS